MSARRSYGWTLDLLAVAGFTVLAVLVLLSVSGGPLSLLVGVPFLTFLPGYALVSAVLPDHPAEESSATLGRTHDAGPGWAVRIALSVLSSALLVGVVGVLLAWTWTVSLVPAVLTVAAITLAGVVVAGVRRIDRPAEYRATPLSTDVPELLPAGSTAQRTSLVVAVVALVAAAALAGVVPAQGESYSESYILTENDSGELVAEDYPTTFVAGEGHSLSLALANHEHETVTYEVVVLSQAVAEDGSVTDAEQVDRFAVELEHGERTVADRQIAPTETGEERRLVFHVYENTDPADAEEPDLTTQLWIEVVEG